MGRNIFYFSLILFLGLIAPVFAEENYETYIDKAVIEIENNNTKAARENFKHAIELNEDLKNSPEVLYNYAKLCEIDGDLNEALKYMLSAVELTTDNPSYYLELGKIYYKKEDYLKAVNAFEYALGQNKEINAESYNFIGLSNYKRGNLKTALENFLNAVEIKNDNIFYLNNLALCYKSLGDEEKYIETIKKLETIIPQSVEEYIQIANLYIDRNKQNEAKKIIKEGLKVHPENVLLKDMYNKLNKS